MKTPILYLVAEDPVLLQETSLPGVFAAGDVRHRSIKRVASAAGEGATAVQLIHQYLGQDVVGSETPRDAVEPVTG